MLNKTLKIGLLTAVVASTTAFANPTTTVSYEYNNALKKEGVNLEVGYNASDIVVGLNTLVDEDRVHTYGATLGFQLKPFTNVPLYVTPTVGIERYRTIREDIGSVGVGFKYPVAKKTQLDARVKYVGGIKSHEKTDDVVYNIGFTKTF